MTAVMGRTGGIERHGVGIAVAAVTYEADSLVQRPGAVTVCDAQAECRATAISGFGDQGGEQTSTYAAAPECGYDSDADFRYIGMDETVARISGVELACPCCAEWIAGDARGDDPEIRRPRPSAEVAGKSRVGLDVRRCDRYLAVPVDGLHEHGNQKSLIIEIS